MTPSRLLLIIGFNLIIVASEVGFGLLAHSMALIADAVHNLGDVLALIVSYIALIYGAKAASAQSTYGYHRSEMMGAFVNALFLILTMLWVLSESLQRLLSPEPVQPDLMILVALIATLANGFSAYLLHKGGMGHAHHHHDHSEACDHDHDHAAHHHGDLNLRSAYLHMLGDALLSLGVVAGGVLIWWQGAWWIDPLLSILFALIILRSTWGVLAQSFQSLMDHNRDSLEPIAATLLQEPGVQSVHDLHLTRPSSHEYHLTAHLVFGEDLPLSHLESKLESIRQRLKSHGITHIVLQPESPKYTQDSLLCNRC